MGQFAKKALEFADKQYATIRNFLHSKDPELPTPWILALHPGPPLAGRSGITITMDASYFREHPDDLGAVVHEITHLVQNYPSPDPGWLTEGIADYARWRVYREPHWRVECGMITDQETRKLRQATYEDGYGCAAAFLAFLQHRCGNPDLVLRLNEAMQAGSRDTVESLLRCEEKETGELWRECLESGYCKDPSSGFPKRPKEVAECMPNGGRCGSLPCCPGTTCVAGLCLGAPGSGGGGQNCAPKGGYCGLTGLPCCGALSCQWGWCQ